MSDHSYDVGRLNLPFVGIATFGKRPYVQDWTAIDADVAVLGAPFDFGTQFRAGARFGPRAVREASTLFSFGHAGAYDHEDDAVYLPEAVRIVDIGDADIIHTDTVRSHANIAAGVRAILDAGAFPVVIGGDHSVNIPCIEAFAGQGPIHILHIDAHLDFVDERHGVRNGHGSPLRRAAEKPYVTGLTQVGIRNVSSTAKEGYDAARAMGSDILSVRQMRKLGAEAVIARIPEGARVYVTLDIDGFCPSIAPGTGTPSHGGFLYYEVLEMLQALAKRHEVVGIDLVEVAPDYDHSGSTAILAAQVLLNFLGFVFHARSRTRCGESRRSRRLRLSRRVSSVGPASRRRVERCEWKCPTLSSHAPLPEPRWLSDWQAGPIPSTDALARFDALLGVEPEAMIGRWRGTGLPTGHPLDGVLESLGWYGKAFESADRVHPLLFRTRSGEVIPLDPRFMPVSVALRWPAVARSAPVRMAFAAGRAASPLQPFRCEPASRGLSGEAKRSHDLRPKTDHRPFPQDRRRPSARVDGDAGYGAAILLLAHSRPDSE